MKIIKNKDTFYLFIIFALSAIAIIAKSFFSHDGYLSPDSTNYLKLAQTLLDGNGFYVSNYTLNGSDRAFFATWPVGYPTLIFIVAKIFHLSVFLASKLLNIIFIGLSLYLIKKVFKTDSFVYGLVFLFGAYIVIFSHTWSEVPFIFGLLWFSSSIYYHLNKPASKTLLFNLFVSALFLFLMRYIGTFSFGVIGLLAIYYFTQKKYRYFFTLSFISLAGLMIVSLYLYHNYIEVGFSTGMPRIPSPETNFELLKMLINACMAETFFLHAHQSGRLLGLQNLIIFILVIVYLVTKTKFKTSIQDKKKCFENFRIWKVFLLVGVIYYVAIISVRWLTHFDGFSYRLLGPGTFLIILGGLNYIQKNSSSSLFSIVKNFFIACAIASFLINVPSHIKNILIDNDLSYYQNITKLKKLYEKIPPNSIVVFANKHFNYLRTESIRSRPYFTFKEDVQSFIHRITKSYPNKNIFIQIAGTELRPERYHSTWCDFIDNHQNEDFVQIQ